MMKRAGRMLFRSGLSEQVSGHRLGHRDGKPPSLMSEIIYKKPIDKRFLFVLK